MPAQKMVPFDSLAKDYDEVFSQGLVGKFQRGIVRSYLIKYLAGKGSLKILEINCGTGEDAVWLASLGHDVIATDQSERMIVAATNKIHPRFQTNPTFLTCDFEDIGQMVKARDFDLVFSNFSGLNCVPALTLSRLDLQFNSLLKMGGHLSVVIFGKYTLWEIIYYSGKFQFKEAFRRWKTKKTLVSLSHDSIQSTYYHSISKFKASLGHFRLVEKRPVGLFIPPSYMELYFKKHIKFFGILGRLEKKLGNISFLSPFADHVYIHLKKVEQ